MQENKNKFDSKIRKKCKVFSSKKLFTFWWLEALRGGPRGRKDQWANSLYYMDWKVRGLNIGNQMETNCFQTDQLVKSQQADFYNLVTQGILHFSFPFWQLLHCSLIWSHIFQCGYCVTASTNVLWAFCHNIFRWKHF